MNKSYMALIVLLVLVSFSFMGRGNAQATQPATVNSAQWVPSGGDNNRTKVSISGSNFDLNSNNNTSFVQSRAADSSDPKVNTFHPCKSIDGFHDGQIYHVTIDESAAFKDLHEKIEVMGADGNYSNEMDVTP
jgi:hypothetical protein